VDGRAIDRLGFGVLHVKHLLDPPHVILRFGQMMLQRRPKLRICTFFDHGRKRLQNLLLGVINVPEDLDKQLVHCLDTFGKEAHGFYLFDFMVGLNWSTQGSLEREPLYSARTKPREEPSSLSAFSDYRLCDASPPLRPASDASSRS